VEAVLADYTSAPIDDAWKALFAFIEVVNARCAQVDQAAVDAVKAAGWSEEAIYDAITVCALFNFFNRWIDGTGVSGMNAKAYEQSGHRMKTHGYAPPGRIVLDK
jgi:alkylhydroperoxidase family enzyme